MLIPSAVWLLAPVFTSLIIPKEADVVNAVLPLSPHPTTSISVLLCLYLHRSSLPALCFEKIPVQACQSVTEVSSTHTHTHTKDIQPLGEERAAPVPLSSM